MEGKKRYIAIILFLLICLMLFTFATTGDEELEAGNGNGNDIQEVTNKGDSDKDEEKDSDSEKEESNDQNSSSTGSSNNGNSNAGDDEDLDGTGNTDNSAWDKALAAVEELEKVLTDDQLNIARELVEEITNSDQYKELIERVEDAEDAIDATALVEALEKMVEEAAKREDIEDASDFRDDEVLDAVNEIDGEYLEEVKEDLLDRIEKLNKILDDATAPKVEGIEDGDTTKKDVELTITDDNEVTTTVTKDGQTYEYVEKFTEEGTYELTVVDSAFNETKLTFTIDKTAPKFIEPKNGSHYTSIEDIKVEDATEVTVVIKNQDTGKEVTAPLTEDATYYITATDAAGNSKSIYVAIDNTYPVINGVDETKPTNKNEIVYVSDKFLTKVIIDGKEYTRSDFEVGEKNENFKFQKKITKEGTHTVVAIDKIGNTTTKTFVIDKTAAKVKSSDFYVHGLTQVGKVFYTQKGNKITVNVKVNEELGQVPTFTLHNNGKDYVLTDVLDRGENAPGVWLYQASYVIEDSMADGEVTFTISNIVDKAGNVTADVTAPTNGRRVIVDNTAPKAENLAILGGKGYWVGKEYKQYATNGTIVYVNVRMYEELATTPVVTLNDTVTLTNATKKESNGVWIYSYSYRLKENDGIADGVLQVKVTNIADLAGNSIELTNADCKMESQSEVIVDRKPITIEGINASEYIYDGVGVTPSTKDKDVQSVELTKDGEIVENYELGTAIINAGSYKLVVKDLAGNPTTIEFVINKKQLEFDLSVEEVYEYAGNEIKATINVTNAESESVYEIDDRYYIMNEKGQFMGPLKVDYAKDLGTYKVKVVIKSTSENYADSETKSLTFKVVDTTAPTITLPFPMGKETYEYRIESGTEVTLEDIMATVTDNYDKTTTIKPYKADLLVGKASENTYNYDLSKGIDTRQIGRYNIYYTYTDKSGNTTNVTLLLFMKDTTPATITIPGTEGLNKNEYIVESGTEVTLEDVLATVTDNVDPESKLAPYKADLLISNKKEENKYNYDFSNGFETNYHGRYNLYYTYTDKAGHTTNAGMMIVMKDTVAPTLEITEKGNMVYVRGKDVTRLKYTITKDGKKVHTVDSETCGCGNYFSITWLAKTYGDGEYTIDVVDAGGNKATATAIVDTTAPVATPSYTEKDLEVNTVEEFTDFPTFDVKDNYSTNVKEELISGEVNTKKLGTYELVYRFTDEKGNYADVTVKVNVVDTTAPQMTLNGETNIVLEAGIDKYEEKYATATDNYDETINNIPVDYIHYTDKDGVFRGKVSSVDNTKLGTYKVVYTHEDSSNNAAVDANKPSHKYIIRFVTVQDTIDPELIVKEESIGVDPIYRKISFKLHDIHKVDYVMINGKKFDVGNAPWSDANYGNIKKYLVEGENTATLYDEAGNSVSKTFTMDWTAPTVESQYRTDLADKRTDVIGSDAHNIVFTIYKDDKLVHTVDAKSNYKRFSIDWLGDGVYKVVVTDIVGLSSEITVTIDHTAPVATPSYTELTVEGDKNATFNQFPTFEIEDLTEVKTELISGEVNMGKVGEYTLTYQFTDEFNNSSTQDVVVKVVDTTAPVVTAKADSVVYVEYGTSYTELGAIVKDNIDEDRELTKPSYINIYELGENNATGPFVRRLGENETVDPNVIGKYLLVYTATDAAGNASNNQLAESKIWVVVRDTTAPTFRFTKAGSSLVKDEIQPTLVDGVYYFNQPVRVTISDSLNLRLHGVNSYYDDNNPNRTGWLTDLYEDGEYTAVGVDSFNNRAEFKFVIDSKVEATSKTSSFKYLSPSDPEWLECSGITCYFNNQQTYEFNFAEPVKITNIVGESAFGEETILPSEIEGFSSNADAEGYGTSFKISYNQATWLDFENFVKTDFLKFTFVDKKGNAIVVDSTETDSNIAVSIKA